MATGKDLVNIALGHIGEDYVLGTMVPKNDSSWNGPWDCAEFVSWCIYQVAKVLYGCTDDHGDPASADAYTGYWARDARTRGKQISVQEAAGIAGAAVLRCSTKMGHIVISDGQGGTVEAAGAAYGVIRGQLANRRWDMGILIPGINYEGGQSVPMPSPPKVYHLTDPRMMGEKVKEIQRALLRAGFNPIDLDGIYGPRTTNAVGQFQRAKGLVPDGEVGQQTLHALGVR